MISNLSNVMFSSVTFWYLITFIQEYYLGWQHSNTRVCISVLVKNLVLEHDPTSAGKKPWLVCLGGERNKFHLSGPFIYRTYNLLPLFLNINLFRDFSTDYIRMYIDVF